jgi:hypothetical protein
MSVLARPKSATAGLTSKISDGLPLIPGIFRWEPIAPFPQGDDLVADPIFFRSGLGAFGGDLEERAVRVLPKLVD